MEIDRAIEGADTVRFIKAERIKWLVHVQTIDQERTARKQLDWKAMGIFYSPTDALVHLHFLEGR